MTEEENVNKPTCEYLGHYLEWDDDEQQENEVLQCKLFTENGLWDYDSYCNTLDIDDHLCDDCKLFIFIEKLKKYGIMKINDKQNAMLVGNAENDDEEEK